MRNHTAVRRHDAAKVRQQRRDRALAIADHGADFDAAERRLARAPRVFLDKVAHFVDGANAAHIAFALRLAPGEEPVTAEDEAVAAGRGLDRTLQHQRELESRPLPRHPDDLPAVSAIELLHL